MVNNPGWCCPLVAPLAVPLLQVWVLVTLCSGWSGPQCGTSHLYCLKVKRSFESRCSNRFYQISYWMKNSGNPWTFVFFLSVEPHTTSVKTLCSDLCCELDRQYMMPQSKSISQSPFQQCRCDLGFLC